MEKKLSFVKRMPLYITIKVLFADTSGVYSEKCTETTEKWQTILPSYIAHARLRSAL